jgi:serine/threonine protein kinase
VDERTPEDAPVDGTPPPEVPDYELLRPIGRGGFGQVWLARNRATGQPRAVKVIPLRSTGAADPAGREVTSIARLEANLRRRHENLLVIHHVGKTADHLYYVMDLADDVSGKPGSANDDYCPATLKSRLDEGPLPADKCFRYARQLLDALASLHAAGMVHRDVKPANCLFVDGQLKLADFGLLAEASPQISRVGTVTYMPPDGRMDARADVYAAGLVIYEMITALPADSFPRPGDRAAEAVTNPMLTMLNRILLQACEPDPRLRFADAQEMFIELDLSEPTAVARRTRLLWRKIATVVAGIGLLIALVVWLWPEPPTHLYVNFVTDPFEATIYIDDELQMDDQQTVYTTPCTIENLPTTVHHVVFRHDLYGDLDVGLHDFAKERRIEGHWPTEP